MPTECALTTEDLRGLSRSELARLMRVDVSNVSRLLTDNPKQRRIPKVRTFYRLSLAISEVTGQTVTMDDLYRLLYR